MASELEHFLTDQLAQLPENHPHRPFLVAQKALVDAFLDRATPGPLPDAVPTPETAE